MFFRKTRATVSGDASVGVESESKCTSAQAPSTRSAHSDDQLTAMVLDALGGVISALARFPIDLPQRSAADAAKDLSAWHRHVTLGLPREHVEGGAAVGIGERDWRGLIREVATMRRDEQTTVGSLVTELREALWSCVSAVHESVRVDSTAVSATDAQLTRMRGAITGSNLSTIREEVLSAVGEIDRALRARRDEQQRQYTSLADTLDALGQQLEEAKKESETDPLTNVGNRKHFDLMSARAVQLASLSRGPVTLLMIDLNQLKRINDTFGHQVGDAAIVSVANALWRVFLRQSDVVCRYGGDEFAVVLNGTDGAVAEKLALRLVNAVRELPRPHEAMDFALGASVGVAQLQLGETLSNWVARADAAMYEAKKAAHSVGVLVATAEHAPVACAEAKVA
jgi:diguanylate cyclase